MKRFFSIIFVFTFIMVLPSFSQKKELDAARTNIKKGEKLDESEKALTKLLADSTMRRNTKVWAMLFEVLKKKVEQDNEKLFLHQKTDTLQLFTTTYHLFHTLEGLDSLCITENAVNQTYRKKHADFLMKYVGNLLGGGIYFIRNNDNLMAYNFFQTYLEIPDQPLFSSAAKLPEQSLQQAAYGAMLAGYRLDDASKIYRYADLAKKDNAKRVFVLQYLAETFRKEMRMNEYRNTLEEGFLEYPLNRYFYTNLILYYEDCRNYEKMLETSQKLLRSQNDNAFGFLGESTAYLNLQRYDEAINAADSCLKIQPDMAKALCNAGLAYYQECQTLLSKLRLTKREKAQRDFLLQQALPYLEQYRKEEPGDKDSWGKPLYDIYLNLNQGDKFDEIDNLLNK